MAVTGIKRKLAAVLAADVAGYTKMMAEDEDATMESWWASRNDVIDPIIAEAGGRIVKHTGDGFLAEFASVADAVCAAVNIQTELGLRNKDLPDGRRMDFRMGINLGDVIADDEDIYGDGVNIAARLEQMAAPGGLCVSGNVYAEVQNKLGLKFADLGLQKVKNIDDPIQVYALELGRTAAKPEISVPAATKPSIAVLPFTNIGGDPEQEYFADGVTEDIITALSRLRWLYVVARNSTFAYKGTSRDIRDVARDLGVRYVLEGSIRKARDRIRLTAQLIDGDTGNHVWAKRYDRQLEDIFAVQDELTEMIMGEIEPEMSKAEQERAKNKKPENLDAWDIYQRGMSHLYRLRKEDLSVAEAFFERAIKLDPEFGPAYCGLTLCHAFFQFFGWSNPSVDHHGEAIAAGKRAVSLDGEDPVARGAIGYAYLIGRDPVLAVLELERAIELNPSDARAHAWFGTALSWSGRADEGMPFLEKSLLLSPGDPANGPTMVRMAEAYLFLGNDNESVMWSHKALRQSSTQVWGNSVLAAAQGHLGRHVEASRAIAEMLHRRPDFDCRFVKETMPVTDPDYLARYIDGLAKAGLPECRVA